MAWRSITDGISDFDFLKKAQRMSRYIAIVTAVIIAFGDMDSIWAGDIGSQSFVLRSDTFKRHIDSFNANDDELYPGYITNGAAWSFLKDNIPLFECPDRDTETTYYFRWWTYRKHLKLTPDGFIITEFLPDVPWAGKDDSIDCAAGHHIYEGRWLADPKYLDDYSMFWFRKGGNPRLYSTWLADALWARYLVNGDSSVIKELLPNLISNFQAWEQSHLGTNGLFLQTDDRDGMEMSIGGAGGTEEYRPTINSYMYGDAVAIAKIADLSGRADLARQYRATAAQLKMLVQETFWNRNAQFFENLRPGEKQLVNVREELGYTPWYFNLPDDNSIAWKQLMNPRGFYARFGPTTVEQRDPRFRIAYTGHECQWNGPGWPFATSVTLTAMANLLNNYRQNVVNRQDYFDVLKIYTKSQQLKLSDGRTVPWIDEDLDPYRGMWIARAVLKRNGAGIPERGKDYNHSTYCDLIICGLVGLRPRADNIVEVNPLVPNGAWDYFCLDNVHYHGHVLTILYDKTGGRYGKGAGLRVFADEKLIATRKGLGRLIGKLTR